MTSEFTATSPLLERGTAQVVRELALERLEQARAALADTEAGARPDALHDFRVALRRLRGLLASFGEALDPELCRTAQARLRRIGSATGAARDAEVQREWLRERLTARSRALRAARAELDRALAARERTGYARARSLAAPEFFALWSELREAWLGARAGAAPPADSAESFGRASGRQLAQATQRLQLQLGRVHSLADEAPAHEGRLAAKQLRYALELIGPALPAAERAAQPLRRLQRVLGEFNDLRTLRALVRSRLESAALERVQARVAAAQAQAWNGSAALHAPPAREAAAAETEAGAPACSELVRHEPERPEAALGEPEGREDGFGESEGREDASAEPAGRELAPGEPEEHEDARGEPAKREPDPRAAERRAAQLENGCLEVLRAIELRRAALFAQLTRGWLHGGAEAKLEPTYALLRELLQLGEPHAEIERKYLLTALPELPAGAHTLEIEQGYTGADAPERLRRVRDAQSELYYRTLKLGAGVRRLEFEQPLERARFEELWPRTAGCRIRKRRHRVTSAAGTWEIDEFIDRPLVLAELELAAESAQEPELPSWLAPVLVREVSDDPDYTNFSLARSGATPRA
jgi:CHAD domain-containing protein/CYTH domain-containing protein